jgi:hypothetical protein
MATLEDLLPQALSQAIMTPEQQQARIDAQVAAAMPAMLRQYGNTQQSLLENMYARGMGSGMMPAPGQEGAQPNGMGLSTYLAQQLAPLQAQQSEAAARIRQQAMADTQAAQNAALGNAASYTAGEKNRQAQMQINAANNLGAAQRQASGANSAAARQRTQGIMSGLMGLGGGAGKIGLGMLTAKPNDAGSLPTVWNNVKGILGMGGSPQIPPIQATPGAAGEAGPPPSFASNVDMGGGGDLPTSNYSVPDLNYQGPDYSGAFDSMGSGNLFDWAMPQVNNSSLWDLMNFDQVA